MLILGIETSCDETGAAVLEGEGSSVKLLSNVITSSLPLHSKTGGIIPENAAREQIKFIIPVIKKAIENCKLKIENLDSIAVTYGPGLIGSLLVGLETAKTLSYVWGISLIPVNHLIGHIYANFIEAQPKLEFPAVGLIVSGGHTDLILMKGHGSVKWLGGTRDDAAGEAFDKIGRLLGLPYPGGPHIERAAKEGNPKHFNFPSPLINSNDFDFSFSGLKTAVFRKVKAIEQPARHSTQGVAGGLNNETIADISASVQKAIIDVLIKKTLKATKQYGAKSILLGGGVAANSSLRENFKFQISNFKLGAQLFVPTKSLCTDNAAMIAAAAFFSTNGRSASGGNNQQTAWQKLDANPSLYFT